MTLDGFVETDMVGSLCDFEFEVDDDATEDQIEEAAREAMFERITWGWSFRTQ